MNFVSLQLMRCQQITTLCFFVTTCQIVQSDQFGDILSLGSSLMWPPKGYHYEPMSQIQRRFSPGSYKIMPFLLATVQGKLITNNGRGTNKRRKNKNKKQLDDDDEATDTDDKQLPDSSTNTDPSASNQPETPPDVTRKKRGFFFDEPAVSADDGGATAVKAGTTTAVIIIDGPESAAFAKHDTVIDGLQSSDDAMDNGTTATDVKMVTTYLPVIKKLAKYIVPKITPYQVIELAVNVARIASMTVKNNHRKNDKNYSSYGFTTHHISNKAADGITAEINSKLWNSDKRYTYEYVKNLLNSSVGQISSLELKLKLYRNNSKQEIDRNNNNYSKDIIVSNELEKDFIEDNVDIREDITDDNNDRDGCNDEYVQYDAEKVDLAKMDDYQFRQSIEEINNYRSNIIKRVEDIQLMRHFDRGLNIQLLQKSAIDKWKFFEKLVNTKMKFDERVTEEDIKKLITMLINVTNFFIANAD